MLIEFRSFFSILSLIIILSSVSLTTNETQSLLKRRTKRDILIVDGTSVAIKWLITFPLQGVTIITTVMQLTHLIEVPLMRIYPENRPKEPFNVTTFDDLFKNSDLAQFFNQVQRYYTAEGDSLLNGLEISEGRSFQGRRDTDNYFEELRQLHNLGNLTGDQKTFLTEFMTDLEASRRENERRKFEKSIIYKDLISLFETFGLSGKACLLHAICEIADTPFEDSLMGEMFNLIMTPTSGNNPMLFSFDLEYNEYVEAELEGKRHGDCNQKFNQCAMSFFTYIEYFLNLV